MRFVYIGQTTKDPFDLCAHNNSDENQTDLWSALLLYKDNLRLRPRAI